MNEQSNSSVNEMYCLGCLGYPSCEDDEWFWQQLLRDSPEQKQRNGSEQHCYAEYEACKLNACMGGDLGGLWGTVPQSFTWGTIHAFVPPIFWKPYMHIGSVWSVESPKARSNDETTKKGHQHFLRKNWKFLVTWSKKKIIRKFWSENDFCPPQTRRQVSAHERMDVIYHEVSITVY